MTLLELNFQRRKAKNTAQELLDRAITEGRALSIAEQVRFDSFTAQIAQLDEAIAERESLRTAVQ